VSVDLLVLTVVSVALEVDCVVSVDLLVLTVVSVALLVLNAVV
jgi:hypothetical protein